MLNSYTTIQAVSVQRFRVTSTRSFQDVLSRIEAAVGHPDTPALMKEIAAAKTVQEMESLVEKAVGVFGLMEFARFDMGAVLRKGTTAETPRMIRLLVGNPLIMKQMALHVPDAGSYAPVTILINEHPDGVHLAYDRMASFIASYGNAEALKVARELDTKIEALLTGAV